MRLTTNVAAIEAIVMTDNVVALDGVGVGAVDVVEGVEDGDVVE